MKYNNGDVIIFKTKESMEHIGRIVSINDSEIRCGTVFHLASSEDCALNRSNELTIAENNVSGLASSDEESQYELLHTMFTHQYRL